MSDVADVYIDKLIVVEGGYVNNSADKGGPTCWGITQAVARANGYTGPMQSLPRDLAASIYKAKYWVAPHFDSVNAISTLIAQELLDIGVNMGQSTGVQWLQRGLNVLNRQGKDYADVGVDGGIGGGTLQALKSLLAVRGKEGELNLLKVIVCLRGAKYVDLGESRPADEQFEEGWFANRIHLNPT